MTPLGLMESTLERYAKMSPRDRKHDYIKRTGITRGQFDIQRDHQLWWKTCGRKNYFKTRDAAQEFMENIGEELRDPENARTYKCPYTYPVEHYHFGHSEIPEETSPGVWTFE